MGIWEFPWEFVHMREKTSYAGNHGIQYCHMLPDMTLIPLGRISYAIALILLLCEVGIPIAAVVLLGTEADRSGSSLVGNRWEPQRGAGN